MPENMKEDILVTNILVNVKWIMNNIFTFTKGIYL